MITPTVSTSSFKPLSLQEVMMVPLQKQQQEDTLMAEADAMSKLEASTLSVDQDQADKIVADFKNRVAGMSDELLENGVDRNMIRKMKKLKGEVEKEYASGYLGSAIGNKKSAGEYIKALSTDKARQAGWSPKQARQWAIKQVSDFKGTQGANGFNSFSGAELDKYMDEDKFIRDSIDDIAEKVDHEALHAVKIGGMDALQRGFAEKTITSKDYNTIMGHLKIMTASNPELKRHLKQAAFFNGEDPDAIDRDFDDYFGKFEIVKNKEGKDVRRWKVGSSRFGIKSAGIGSVSSYRISKEDARIIKSPVASMAYADGLSKKNALNLVTYEEGRLNTMTPQMMEETQETLDLLTLQADDMFDAQWNRKNQLEKEFSNLTDEQIAARKVSLGMDEKDELTFAQYRNNDPEYQEAYKRYSKFKNSSDALRNRMNGMYKKIDSQLTRSQRNLVEVGKQVKDAGSAKAVLDNLGEDTSIEALIETAKEMRQTSGQKYIDRLKEGVKDSELEPYQKKYKEDAINELMSIKLAKYYGIKRRPLQDMSETLKNYNQDRNELVSDYIAANPQSERSTVLSSSSGKGGPIVGKYNDQRSKDFNPEAATLAYGAGDLKENQEFLDILKLAEKEGEEVKYKVNMTTGMDHEGDPYDQVEISVAGKTMTVSVKSTINSSNRIKVADEFMQGDATQYRLGLQMKANEFFGKSVRESGFGSAESGIIDLNGLNMVDKRTDVLVTGVEYQQHVNGLGEKYWTASIAGEPITLDGTLGGNTKFGGMNEITKAIYNTMENIKGN